MLFYFWIIAAPLQYNILLVFLIFFMSLFFVLYLQSDNTIIISKLVQFYLNFYYKF